jgi:Ser/Thr protein kinase RdoA (MazF antagonist)
MRPADAARIARERFGIDARASPLPGELDLNFALDGAGGRHVLKLYAPGTEERSLELQDAALEHLAGLEAVPRLVRTVDGAARSAIDGRPVRVLTWLEGTPWARGGEHTPAMLASLGRTVASVDRALENFDHPALAGRRRWNMTAAGDLLADVGGLARDVLERFTAEVLPRLRALPEQAIHNDANEHNVLLGGDGEVCGLIDFGDLCRAPRACGLAVACAYAMALLAVPERQVLAARRRLPRGGGAHPRRSSRCCPT